VSASPVVRRPEQVTERVLAPGVTVADLLDDRHGCRGLHQRRLRFAGAFTGGAAITDVAGGRGEAWYVVAGSGTLKTAGFATVPLRAGTAVWLRVARRYWCRARPGQDLDVLISTVRAGCPGDEGERPALVVSTLEACPSERTGDREFRVLLSPGLEVTQFAGLIPPGRAPAHHHPYDEVVHVLAGTGAAHLPSGSTQVGPGTSIYLPPYQPHCLENTGREALAVLGVFHPAGSPAAMLPS
jgi:mannose-6-phosphate isomerase-like protein (cupin superfamily)